MEPKMLDIEEYLDSLPTEPIGLSNPSNGKYYVQLVFHGMIGLVINSSEVTGYALKTHDACFAVPKGLNGKGVPHSKKCKNFDLFKVKLGCVVAGLGGEPTTYVKTVNGNPSRPSSAQDFESLHWLVDFNHFVDDIKLKTDSGKDGESLGSLAVGRGVVKTFSLEGMDRFSLSYDPEYFKVPIDGEERERAIAKSVSVEFSHEGDLKIVSGNDDVVAVSGNNENMIIHFVGFDEKCDKGVEVEHFKDFSKMYLNPGTVKALKRVDPAMINLCLNEACPSAALYIA